MSVLRASFLVLFSAAAIAAERPITPPVYGPATASQYDAAIASDGDGWLSVWVDKRALTQEVRGTRIAHGGTVLDPTGIPIHSGETTQPLVTWTGTSYLVLWSSLQLNGVTAVRIDRDGTVIDGPHLLLADAMPASVVSNGTHVVVGYTTKQQQIGALVLNPDASVVRDVRLTGGDVQHRDPAIAWNGSHFAAVWTTFGEHATLEAIRFNAAGKIDDAPRPLPDDAFAFSPAIASDGDGLVVIARESFFDGRYSARRLNADLASVASSLLPEPIRTHASILWLGAHYAVVGDYGYTITSVRLDRDAHVLDAGGITIETLPITGTAPAPAAATNGSDVLVAWHGAFASSNDIALDTGIDVYGTFLSPATLQRETRTLFSISAAKQFLPFVAGGGTNLLAVWSEGSGLYARRLALDGSALDAAPLRLHDQPTLATAAFNGSDYIVAWADSTPTSVVTRRIPREGALRAEGGGSMYGLHPPLAMASNGTATLLAASSRVLQLAADGGFFVSPPITLTDALVGDVAIAAGANGTFLVAWGEMEYIDPFYDTAQPVRVRGARITESSLNLDPGGFAIADTPAAREGDPAVAWNGSEWLVVWSSGALRGRRVTQAGFVLDEQAGVFIANSADRPEVAWDGARYVLAWYGANGTFDPHPIHIAWLPQLGAPLAHERIVGEVETFLFTPVSLAPIGERSVAAFYARIAPERQYGGVTRAFVNVLEAPIVRRRAVR